MENRIDHTFAELKKRQSKAFVAYITAGDPRIAETPNLVFALERAGVDVIELGVPFSDPLADGVVNQLAAQRALESGTTLEDIFEAVRTIRKKSQIPIVLFTYYNPIHHYGLDHFQSEATKAGVDGVLLLDLPPEESKAHSLEGSAIRRITLIAPTTPEERIKAITGLGSGFIYYVSREGVTGMQSKLSTTISEHVSLVRKHSSLPICVGFGISTPEQAAAVAGYADGVVIGSALVSKVAEWGKDAKLAEKLENFTRPLAEAIHSGKA
jgi:tryptophan synthase alpha chain